MAASPGKPLECAYVHTYSASDHAHGIFKADDWVRHWVLPTLHDEASEWRSNPWIGISKAYNIHARPPTVGLLRSYAISDSCVKRATRNLVGWLVRLLSQVWVALRLVFSGDAFVGIGLTLLCTLLYWYYAPDVATPMNWNVFSFGISFPITQGIAMSFQRRERALFELGELFAHLNTLFAVGHTWLVPAKDWADGGALLSGERKRMICCLDNLDAAPEDARLAARALFDELLVGLITYFDSERFGRARHTVHCVGGPEEEAELKAIAHEQRLVVDSAIGRVRRMVQDFKGTAGLPGGEAHRLDQYISRLSVSFERLCTLKEYRSPQGFRSFARVYILLMGALYGPYYLYLGLGQTGSLTNLWLSLVFACSTQLVMTGLFNVMLHLEDVFARSMHAPHSQVDAVRVSEFAELSRRQLLLVERDAHFVCEAGEQAAGLGSKGMGWAVRPPRPPEMYREPGTGCRFLASEASVAAPHRPPI